MNAAAVSAGVTPGEDVLIRIADAAEIAAVGKLGRQAYESTYSLEPEYLDEIEDAASRAVTADLWVAVDRVSGELLGTITAPRPGERLQDDTAADEMDIRLLAVAPAARGRGVGQLLMNHSASLARARGARRIVLHTGDIMVGAQRLYERLGYERIFERETWFEFNGERREIWAYGLDLELDMAA